MNQRGGQLIFTTHDTSLLDKYLFRRDEIDFSPRKNEAFERGYLAGRYGALSFLSEMRS